MRHLSWKFSASTRFCVILLMVLHLHSLELEIFDLGDENKEIKHMKCGKLNGSEEYHCLPSFIIAGTQKSGTTALAAFLSEHNEISFSRRKEVHFFDKTSTYNKGIEEYIKAFRPWDPSSSAGRNPPLYGEATPFYLASRLACKRMAKQLGKGVKIIVMLREPTARAYSEYQMKKRRVEEQNDFLLLLQQHQSELHECMVAHPKSITAIGKCVPQVLRNHSRWDKLKTAWKKTFDKSKNWDDVVHSCFPIESPKQSEPIPALTAQPTAHRLGEGHTGGCTGSWKMPMTFGSPYLASRPLCNCDTACICGEQNVAPGWIIAAPSLNHCQNDCAFLGSPGLCYHSIGRNISESTESCSKDHRVQPLDPSFELRHSDATVPSQGGNAALLSVSPPLRGSTSMYLPDLSVGNQVESTSGVQQQHHPKFDGKKSGLSNGGSTSVNGSNQKKPLSSAKDLDALVMPRFDAESCWSNHHEGFEKLKSLHAAFVEEIEHFEHCAVNKAATNYCDLGSEIEEGVAAVVGNGNDIDNILEIIDKEKKEDKPPSPPYDIAAAPSDLDIPIVEADASHDSGSARKKIEKEKGKTKKEEGCLTSAQYLSFLNAFEEASRQGSPKTSTSALGTLRSPFKGTDAYATSASGGSGGSGGSAQVEVGWEGSKQNSAVASWFGLNVSEVLASLDYTVNQCLRVRSGISTQYFYRSMYAVQLHHCFQVGTML